MKLLISLFLFLNINFAYCQKKTESTPSFSKAKKELEVVPFTVSFNPGIYRSRLGINPAVENKFNQFGAFVQLYFPFQKSLDKVTNFEKKEKDSTYYGRLFSIRTLAIAHVTNKGGNALGLGMELSFRIKKRLFLKTQLGIVWVEANSSVPDGLLRGLNFHHFWHFNYFITNQIAISFGFNHVSNGKFLSSKPTSNYDMITTGVSFTMK